LSDNFIDDLRLLENLGMIETLNLSDNRITDIDSLEYLTNLRELNLANNHIQDISPLFSLENLEFVDLTGNPVQPRKLRNQGITDSDLESTMVLIAFKKDMSFIPEIL